MKKSIKFYTIACFILYCMLYSLASASDQTFHHQMEITLSPDTSEIQVIDQIRVPERYRNQSTASELHFSLHADLTITAVKGARIASQKDNAALSARPVPLKLYTLTLPPQQESFSLAFSGKINHAVQGPGLEYARSFSYTPGLITSEGVFLASSTAWYPQFEDDMVSFNLNIQIPAGWDVVSQGTLVNEQKSETTQHVIWEEKQP
ncbi:MAG TPA: signal protein PDZ, partial [Nitrosomonas nitrosa]|nr:signal protein PDZ [Nitrosomonas nitrosa]